MARKSRSYYREFLEAVELAKKAEALNLDLMVVLRSYAPHFLPPRRQLTEVEKEALGLNTEPKS
jgi:hypothetical protein